MVVLVVVEKRIIDIEHEEQFTDKRLTLDEVFGKDGFSVIVMQVADLNFKAELLWQIVSFNQEVTLLQVVDLARVLVVDRDLVDATLVIGVIVPLLGKI